MNIINSYPSTWFKPILVTGATRVIVTLVTATALVSTSGTGSSKDDAALFKDKLSNEQSYGTQFAPSLSEKEERTTSACLKRIREFFAPSVSDLAAAFGVSRQTVYNWQDGDQPKEALAIKLSDLAQAADILGQAGIEYNGVLAKRKFADGKTLFQVVESNASAEEAAKKLVRILAAESKQRKILEARFMNRLKSSQTSDFDLPLASDSI